MNDELERSLREAPRTGVPDSLDLKVEALIRRSERQGRPSPFLRPPLWAVAAACAVFALIGFLAGTSVSSDGEIGVVYVQQRSGPLPSVLSATTETSASGFFQKPRGEVETLYGK